MKKIVSFFLISMLLFSGCARQNVQNDVQQADRDINQYIMGGIIKAGETVSVSSKISERVVKINVDAGTSVKKGDIIILLDERSLSAQLNQAEAAFKTAQANLANIQNGTRPEQLAQAKASLDSARESAGLAKKQYERTKALFDAGAASQSQLDTASQQLAAANAQYKSAEEQWNMLNNGPTKENLEIYKSQVAQAQAALDIVRTNYENTVIKAPISGIVSAKNINEGELASAGIPLVTIVNADALYADAYLPSEYAEKVKVGQKLVVKVSEYPDRLFQGELAVIDAVVNPESKDILVKVSIDDPDGLLKPGMFAQAAIKKEGGGQ